MLNILESPSIENTGYWWMPDLYATRMNPDKRGDKPERIVNLITRELGITFEQLKSKCQKKEVVFCRRLCMFIIKKYCKNLDQGDIASFFDKDRSSIKKAERAIDNYLQTDPIKKILIEKYINVLY